MFFAIVDWDVKLTMHSNGSWQNEEKSKHTTNESNRAHKNQKNSIEH